MNQVVIVGVVVSTILGVSGYLASGNIIVGILSLILPILYFFFIARPMVKKYDKKIEKLYIK